MLLMLPLEINDIILSYLYVKEQIRFKTVCKYLGECQIRSILRSNTSKPVDRLTEKNLTNFVSLEELELTNNRCVENINFLVNLRILRINGICCIPSSAIYQLKNLVELNCNYNYNITCLPPSPNILILLAAYPCKIGDEHVSKLNLRKLDCSQNLNITKIKHFKLLRCLTIDKKSGISQEELNLCTSIEMLSVVENHDIKNIDGLKNIKLIYIDDKHPLVFVVPKNIQIIIHL